MSPRAALDYNRLSLMIILSVVFYNEILVYFNTYRTWPEVEQQRFFKILFVADPVIVCCCFLEFSSLISTMYLQYHI